MSTYNPGRTGHRALQCIGLGSASKGDVRRALGLPSSKGGKSNAMIENMRVDGLVSRRSCGTFWLTLLGEEALATLDDGRSVTVERGRMMEPA